MMKRILLYLINQEELDFMYPLVASNPSIEYGILIPDMNLDDFLRTPSGGLSNIRFMDWKAIDMVSISQYGLFISTDTRGLENNSILFSLFQIFSSINVPIIELQNCLLPKVEISLSSHRLEWHDTKSTNSTSIGYPPATSKFTNMQGEYLLVLTDFESPLYSDKDISMFSHTVFEYVRLHKANPIIWKFTDKTSERTLKAIEYYKIFYRNESDKIFFCNDESLLNRFSISEMIRKSRLVITTPTMSRLLDCEVYNIPVAIYANEKKTWELLHLGDITVFQNARELENGIFDNPCKLIQSNLLKPYDNLAYLKVIERFYMETPSIDEHAYINAIVSALKVLGKDETLNEDRLSGCPSEKNEVEIQRLKSKYRKHIKVIRTMGVGLIILSLALITLLFTLYSGRG